MGPQFFMIQLRLGEGGERRERAGGGGEDAGSLTPSCSATCKSVCH